MNNRQQKPSLLGTRVLTEIAYGYAQRVHSEEKRRRMGTPVEAELSAICHFFTGRGDVVELDGNPFAESPMLPDDLFVLTMNVFAIALDASVVVPVTEVWTASECA